MKLPEKNLIEPPSSARGIERARSNRQGTFAKRYHTHSRTIGEIAVYRVVCKAYQEWASF
jgi:hypothetical protein